MSILADLFLVAGGRHRDAAMSGGLHTGDSMGSEHYQASVGASAAPREAAYVTALMERALGVDRIDAFFRLSSARVASALPTDVLVTFEILGDGGGTWTLHTVPGGLKVQEGRTLWTDSVLRCTLPRFLDLVTGAVDVQQAFLDGTVQVEGDVGLLLRLYQALPQAV